MAEPKRFDPNNFETFLKNSADKTQVLSYSNAAVDHGKSIEENDENLNDDHDDKQIAELLLLRKDPTQKRERLIQAVQNAMKLKYQPQITKAFAQENRKMQSLLEGLQQRSTGIGRFKMLMSAMHDKNEIHTSLYQEEKKRAVDERMVSNERLRNDAIANGKNIDEEENEAACQELLQKRSDIKTKTEALLKSGDAQAILRSLEDAEQRLADVRVSSTADKSRKSGTSSQRESQLDNVQK